MRIEVQVIFAMNVNSKADNCVNECKLKSGNNCNIRELRCMLYNELVIVIELHRGFLGNIYISTAGLKMNLYI